MNPPDHPAALTAREIVRALVSSGVRDVVVAPGSRSAPLAYALFAAQQAGLVQLQVRIDERSAGFLALGIARHRPVAVVTTSGTAVANLHPAVLEASHSRLPVLVISADRPHELRGVGANQTTDQSRLFGAAVRWQGEIPAAHSATAAALGVGSAVQRGVAAARGLRTGDPGPAHLNVAFRSPLTPAVAWEPTDVHPAEVVIQVTGADPIPTLLPRGPRTVIVAGDGAGSAALDLADVSGWPILAEPTSGVRGHRNAMAAPPVVAGELAGGVERVVVLGRPTLSRGVSALLAHSTVEVIVAGPGPDWVDVSGSADLVTRSVTVLGGPDDAEQGWLEQCAEISGRAVRALTAALDTQALSGPSVARTLLGHIGVGAVHLGSSMPVRDADVAAPVGADFTRMPVSANRGLAGIDGTLSTAAGLGLATGEPVRALVGDLTFQHDVGGLAVGRLEEPVDLQVIVLNDDGGSIFATLEHGEAEHAEVYPRMFGTPQGLNLADLTAGFGAGYAHVDTHEELLSVLAAPVSGRSVVEVRLNADSARERFLELRSAIHSAIVE